jgi:hypothetical protein
MAKTRAGSGQVAPNLHFQGTTGIVLPVGTTTNRSGVPTAGEIRYNNELNVFEGYTGSVWGSMGPYPFLNVAYFTGDSTTVDFVCNFTIPNANSVIVTVNGVQLRATVDWQLVGSTTIRFVESSGDSNPPGDGADITVRSFSPLSSASIPSGSISPSQIATVNSGTNGQVLSLDNSGNLKYITLPSQDPTLGGDLTGTASNAQIKAKSVGIPELNVTDGQLGQVLATDGSGNLTFVTIPRAGTGTVTNVSILSANGFSARIDNNTTSPSITLIATVTGMVKGDGATLSAATAGTDYVVPSGNVATATKLATPRNINGVAFDGTADIVVKNASVLHGFNIVDGSLVYTQNTNSTVNLYDNSRNELYVATDLGDNSYSYSINANGELIATFA